ncbi:MAG: hypothetical protein AAFY35_16020 [Pseudomonadota bacterium]
MQQLSFHITESYPYPTPPAGGDTAMTLCKTQGDTFLALLAQRAGQDTITLLGACEGDIQIEYPSPPDRPRISGMGYSPVNGLIYCGSSSATRQFITAINPFDGTVVHDFEMENPGFNDSTAFGTNGFFLVRGFQETLELRTMAGDFIASRTYPDRLIRGVSASPFSWTLLDGINNEIVVLSPFGEEIAFAPAPGIPATGVTAAGTATGPHAIAFDYVTMPYNASKKCIPSSGVPVSVFEGSEYDPDTPWDPAPWQFRHRIYIANQSTETIYVGYLTAA